MRATLLALALLLTLGACLPPATSERTGAAREAVVGGGGDAAPGRPRLRLEADPVRGRAPLELRFSLVIEGELPAGDGRFDCPTVAWVLDSRDDGQVVLAPAEDGCRAEKPQRRFTLTHRYAAAGAYDAYARLLALDLDPSNTVQVVVDGPTPTRQSAAGREGPTIVLATPAPPQPAPAVTSVAGTLAAYRPAATAPPPPAAPAVLPADLYFLAGQPQGLWRLPASGGPIERLSAADQTVFAYAASSAGAVAFSGPEGLRLALRGGGDALVDPAPAGDLVWSRDGRRLAYGNPGLRLLDLGETRPRSLPYSGRPLTWSADGHWLLLAGRASDDSRTGGDGAETLLALDLRADPPRGLELPLPAPRLAGWLPDRAAVWLADPGVHLLRLADPLQHTALLPETVHPEAAVGRADGRLVLIAAGEGGGGEAGGTGRRLYRLDLDAPEAFPAAAAGPAIRPGALAIAPGGAMAARADGSGLWLLDLRTGAEALLLGQAAAQPSWVLGRR